MPTTLTAEVFARLADDDRWLGFGYIGARRNALEDSDPDAQPLDVRQRWVADADRIVLAHARSQRWTYEQLFAWANSRTGRHYADAMFGSPDPDADAARFSRLLALPTR